MKRVLSVIFAIIISLSLFPARSLALGTITQSCMPGTDPERYVFLSHEPSQVFYFAAGTLDAVAVRVKSEIGATTDVHVRIINVTANVGRIVTQKTETVTDTAQWLLFDFSDQELQNGFYTIDIVQEAGGQAIWYLGPSDCYAAGAALYDNARHENEDFRFAVYTGSGGGAQPAAGDDNDAAAGDNDTAADDTSQANDDTSVSQPAGTGTTGTSGGTTGSTDTNNPTGSIAKSGRTGTGVAYGVTESTLANMPSADEILKMTREAREEDKAFNKSLLGYLGTRIGIVLLFFVVLIVLTILAIWLILRHKKKKELEAT